MITHRYKFVNLFSLIFMSLSVLHKIEVSLCMFYDIYVQLCKDHGEKPYALPLKLGAKSNSMVAQWKRGSLPRSDMLQRIADYFSVTTSYLMGQEENKKKNIPTPEGEEFVDEGMEFVELPYESQEALYTLFSDACQKASITEGYAVVRAGLNKDIMLRLRTSSYSMASVAYVRALASYLSVLDEANAILAKAPELIGAKLEIARQMMEQAMRLNLSKFK